MEEQTRDNQIQEINKAAIAVAGRLRDKKSIDLLKEANEKLCAKKTAVKKVQDELKENFRELLSLTEAETSHLQDLHSQTVDPQRKNLVSELAKTERQKEEAERELEAVVSTISCKKEVLKNLENQATSSQKDSSASISQIRSKYSLYFKLSNIKWDHTAPEGVIKGFVLKPEEKRVVPFKFEKASHSEVFITNYLWEQISMGSDFLEEATSLSKN